MREPRASTAIVEVLHQPYAPRLPVTFDRDSPQQIRVLILLTVGLLVGAIVLLASEHRPSFLRPGLRLNAYVTTTDGNVTVVDLVRLRAMSRIPIGPACRECANIPRAPKFGASALRTGMCGFSTRIPIK